MKESIKISSFIIKARYFLNISKKEKRLDISSFFSIDFNEK
jgi:hypothetical protein